MGRSLAWFVVAAVLIASALSTIAFALDTTASAILKSPEKFDGVQVTVRGTVTHLSARVSRKGNAYYTFDLAGGGESIKVFSFGVPACRENDPVIVDGRFDRVKRVSGRIFYNEITASTVACR